MCICGDNIATNIDLKTGCYTYNKKGAYKMDNIVSSAKTDMFRLRINPDIRSKLEDIYA